MLRVYLSKTYKTGWFITLPHEINNEFLWYAGGIIRNGEIPGNKDFPLFNDFGAPVEFSLEQLDKLYNDLGVLENNLDELIKKTPLPRKIGSWEWYNKQFIFFYKDGIEEARKYFPELSDKEVYDIVNGENMVQKSAKFTKQDMLLIISLIKKKILEAKEKGETLIFSGD